MEILIGWLIFSFVAGSIASNKGNSFIVVFFISLLASPLIGIIIALVQRPNKQAIEEEQLKSGDHKKCPFCAETIKIEAAVCRFCGRDLIATSQQPVPTLQSQNIDAASNPPQTVNEDLYFYMEGPVTVGPHTLAEMQRLFRDHRITATTQVYHSQFDWKPAYSLKIWT